MPSPFLPRRRLLLAAAPTALAATLAAPVLRGQAPARVVVVGGGFAGASCALALRRLRPALQLRLFEPRLRFITGPLANAMLAGLRSPAAVSATPAALAAHGIAWRQQAVAEVDPARRRVRDAAGRWHAADQLVLAPGAAPDWDGIAGLDADGSARMPHGWCGDASMRALRARFAALGDGATVLIGVPAHPYRCPPGPYERASLFAWALRGRRAKVLIADAKDDFSLRPLFQRAWSALPAGAIEWLPRAQGGEVDAVDTARGEVRLAGGERLVPDLACIIPPQRAPALCHAADLVDTSGWCPVHAHSFESRRHPGVYVLGDAAAAYPLPKSATAAHSAAQACAAAICAVLDGQTPAPSPVLHSQCHSLLAPDAAIRLDGRYAAVAGRLSALRQQATAPDADATALAHEAVLADQAYQRLLRASFAL